MPKITILEENATKATAAAANFDVAYVPGFANTNANYIIFNVQGAQPTIKTVGYNTAATAPTKANINEVAKLGDTLQAPQFACNVVDRKMWYCAGVSDGDYTWNPVASTVAFVEPYPENEPTLCKTVEDFEGYFGAEPYEFPTAQNILSLFSTGVVPAGNPNLNEANTPDRSYIYAKEIISKGIPVLYENVVVRTNNTKVAPTVAAMYTMLPDCFDKLQDKGEYQVKYITSGGYPTFEKTTSGDASSLVDKMTTCAAERQDAVALIDHVDNPGRTLSKTDSASVYKCVETATIAHREYAAMFTPWALYNCPITDVTSLMPASFNYLVCLGESIQTNANWLAVAGVNRGVNTNLMTLNVTNRLSNAIADSYQPRDGVAINAITNIKPYGLTIWGNRTLSKNADGDLTATSFLNVRNLVSDIKKVAYSTCKSLVYEQNSDVLWINFKSGISPLLENMMSGYGIQGYKIIRSTHKYNGNPLGKGEVAAVIKIVPMYAVEDFEVTVVMEDGDVKVS